MKTQANVNWKQFEDCEITDQQQTAVKGGDDGVVTDDVIIP